MDLDQFFEIWSSLGMVLEAEEGRTPLLPISAALTRCAGGGSGCTFGLSLNQMSSAHLHSFTVHTQTLIRLHFRKPGPETAKRIITTAIRGPCKSIPWWCNRPDTRRLQNLKLQNQFYSVLKVTKHQNVHVSEMDCEHHFNTPNS